MTDREKQRPQKLQLPESMLKLVKTDNYIYTVIIRWDRRKVNELYR